MPEYHTHFIESSSFWALIGLIIFVAILVYLRVPQILMRRLDERALRIEKNLKEASRLREEAQQLLLDYQKKRSEVHQEAKEIIAASKREANKISKEAAQKLQLDVERYQKILDSKILQAEKDASFRLQKKIVNAAGIVSEKLIQEFMDEKSYEKIFSESLKNIKSEIKNKRLN